MAGIFNPIRHHQVFEDGALDRCLNFDNGVSERVAASRLSEIIYAWLVGLHNNIQNGLVSCNFHLQKTLSENSDPVLQQYNHSYALASWLVSGQNNFVAYALSLDAMDAYFSHGWTKVLGPDIFNKQLQKFERNEKSGLPVPDKEILKGFVLCDYLADCIQSGEYSRGVELYERVGGKPIANAKSFKTELALGYWICKQKMQGLEIPIDEYLEMGERVLRHNLEENWLGYGQSVRAAIWLKIVYWHTGITKTPLETLLKAYDVMPNVQKPNFV